MCYVAYCIVVWFCLEHFWQTCVTMICPPAVLLRVYRCTTCSSVRSCQDWHQSLQKKGQIALCLCRTCWRPWPYFVWPENFGSSRTMLNKVCTLWRTDQEGRPVANPRRFKRLLNVGALFFGEGVGGKCVPFLRPFQLLPFCIFVLLTSQLMEHDGIDAGWLVFHHWSAAALWFKGSWITWAQNSLLFHAIGQVRSLCSRFGENMFRYWSFGRAEWCQVDCSKT